MANTYKNYMEKLHYTRNNNELWYNLTIFEDQTLATVWKLLSEIKVFRFTFVYFYDDSISVLGFYINNFYHLSGLGNGLGH